MSLLMQSPFRRLCAGALLLAATLAFAACGGSDSQSDERTSDAATPATEKEVSDEALEDIIRRATGTDIPPADLPPVVVEALKVAAQPMTPELEKQVFDCLSKPTCETGRGDVAVGIVDPLPESAPYAKLQRAAYTLQALRYPSVKELIYVTGEGDLQNFLSGVRAVINRGADVIVGNINVADAALPVVRLAASKGIPFVASSQGVPSAKPGEELTSIIASDRCVDGEERAKLAIENASEPGKAALITGIPGNPQGAVWIPCAEKLLKEAGWTTTTIDDTGWTPQGETTAAAALIASGGVDAILYDYSCEAFLKQYLKENKKPPSFYSFASSVECARIYEDVKEKHPDYVLTTSTGLMYWMHTGITAALKAHAGEEVPAKIVAPDPSVDMEVYLPEVTPELPGRANFNTLWPSEWTPRIME